MEIKKQVCPTCGQSVNEREISLFRELISAWIEVFKWCEEKNKFEFDRKQVKHLIRTDNIIARFGDLVWFGLVYKNGKAHYGINRQYAIEFITGKRKVYTRVYKNPLTKEIKKYEEDCKFIHEFPKLGTLLDENKEYVARYFTSNESQPTLSLF
jgi:hypothetical protein